MTVETFTREHMPRINSWFIERGLNPWKFDDLPKVGYIVGGCIAAWLYQTDGRMAMIENLISDPAAETHKTAAAGMILHSILMEEARSLGYTVIATLSTDPRIEAIFKRKCNGSISRPYMFTTGLL